MTANDSLWQLPCLSSSQELRGACYLRIYLGMVKGNEFDNTIEMKIDTIITPAERIRMYRDKFTVLGSSDIALVKTSKPILFTPNQVTPVQLKWLIDYKCWCCSNFSFKDMFEQSAGGRSRRVRDGVWIRRRRGHRGWARLLLDWWGRAQQIRHVRVTNIHR